MNKETLVHSLRRIGKYISTFAKWFGLSTLTGLFCGLIGCLFHMLIEWATAVREDNFFLVFLLPIGGVVIVAVYRLIKQNNVDGTNYVIESIRKSGQVPFGMAPGIIIGTVITHLLGGSAGREGAALQLGGSLGSTIGRIFKLDEKDLHVMVLCGMSAVFCALFGTPLTAVVFVLEVISVGVIYYSAILPCVFSSVSAYCLTIALKITPATYTITNVPKIDVLSLLQTVALGVMFALVSIILCVTFRKSGQLAKKILKNDYLRVVCGGVAIIGLTLLFGTDYNGAGMGIVENALMLGQARPEAFLLKLLFTAITLSSGFRGGEIVPTFFIGAAFGCIAAPLIGVDAGFGAALGLVGVFCGATNTPIASLFLSVELFGAGSLPFFAVVCATSYMLSGYFSLYKTQLIVYDKLKAAFLNRNVR